jgi:hypothetical protein
VRIKLRTAGLDDLTSIYAIRRDAILGVPSEASLSDRQAWADKQSPNYYQDRITAGHVVIASFEEDNIGWGSSSDDCITGLYVCSS